MTGGSAVVAVVFVIVAVVMTVAEGVVGLTIAFVFSKGSNRASFGSISAPC